MGDHAKALETYAQAQSVRQKLVELDPKNAELPRDLSISFDKIGNVMEEKNELADALVNYRQALRARGALNRSRSGEPERITAELGKMP